MLACCTYFVLSTILPIFTCRKVYLYFKHMFQFGGVRACIIESILEYKSFGHLVAGYGSNKNGFHLPALAAALAARGVASLRFDFSGECPGQASVHS